MAHIITLTGPAHCGKSLISRMFLECKNENFDPLHVSKYTTRQARINDEDVICVKKIPKECDVVYEQYGVRYGIELENLYKLLEQGKTPIIVVNDIRAVEDIKAALGSLVISIFLYRKAAIYDEFYLEEKERATNNIIEEEIRKTAQTRFEKAQAIYRIYIENIQLFDRVILNVFNQKYTKMQVENIVHCLMKDSGGLKEK